jgi:hypothetical protein
MVRFRKLTGLAPGRCRIRVFARENGLGEGPKNLRERVTPDGI